VRDDGRPGLGHIGRIDACEVHVEEEEQGRGAPQAVRHRRAEIENENVKPGPRLRDAMMMRSST